MTHYVGIDVACNTLEVGEASTSTSRQFPNIATGIAALQQWLRNRASLANLHVIVEPTSTYHHGLVQALVREEIRYTLINPAGTTAYARL